MEHVFHSSQWKWQEFEIENEAQADELARKHHTCKKWVGNIKKNNNNLLEVYTGTPGKEIIWGSLVYGQDIKKKEQTSVFHFYLTREELVTANFDYTKVDHANIKALREKLHYSESPIEGFLVIIGEVLNHFLIEIDKFELKLQDLLWQLQEKNSTRLLDRVANVDHELLIWKNLIIPMFEIQMALEEVFGDQTSEGKEFKRTKRRLARARTLIKEYEDEIQALLDLENVVSTHRGNEIMKTLTVLTTLFTPVTALGAVWGMNFKNMPELSWKYGYLFAGFIIIVATFILYIYLKGKGWMGDILSVRSKKSFFK